MRNLWLLLVIIAIQFPQIRGYAALLEAIEHIQIHQNEMLDTDHSGIDPFEEHTHKHSHDSDSGEHEHSHSHPPLAASFADSHFLYPSFLNGIEIRDIGSALSSASQNLKLEQFVFDIFRPPIAQPT